MKGISKMYFIQCEKYDCRTNSVVTRIFCDIDQEDVDPIELDFSNNHIGDAGVRAILGTVHTIRRLQRLNLRGCHLEEGGAIALYEAFKDHPNIRDIDISSNPLFASSGRFLTMLLRSNPNIHTLKVDTSEMPPRVEAALFRVLARNYERAFPEADRIAEESRANEEERRKNVQSSKFLDALLEDLHTPQPADVMRAIQERVVHYWYARLGPFAVQQLADRGISDQTIDYLSSLEKSLCDFTNATDEQPPLKAPSTFLLEEVGRINEVMSKGDASLLGRVGGVRGMTIAAQVESINRLAAMLRSGEYQFEEEYEVPAPAATATTAEGDTTREDAPTDHNDADEPATSIMATRSVNVLAKLVEVLQGFRTGVAGVSLWDFIRHDPLEDTPSMWPTLQSDCKAFESERDEENTATVQVQYERTRKLSLVCDMCRYLSINHAPHVEATRGRMCCKWKGASGTPSFEEAMRVYHAALGTPPDAPSDAPQDRTQPAVQRRELMTEAASLLPPKAHQYLQYVQEAQAYEAGVRVGVAEDPSLVGLSSDSISAILALTFPMYYYRPPTLSASEVMDERSPGRSRVRDAPPSRGEAIKVNNIGEELSGLREKRRREQEECAARSQRLLYADAAGAELFDEVVHGGHGLVNGLDTSEVIGNIQSKHHLRTFLLAVDSWRRYEYILTYTPSSTIIPTVSGGGITPSSTDAIDEPVATPL